MNVRIERDNGSGSLDILVDGMRIGFISRNDAYVTVRESEQSPWRSVARFKHGGQTRAKRWAKLVFSQLSVKQVIERLRPENPPSGAPQAIPTPVGLARELEPLFEMEAR